MLDHPNSAHHLVASFSDGSAARRALDQLGKRGFDRDKLSLVKRHDEDIPPVPGAESATTTSTAQSAEEADEIPRQAVRGAYRGVVIGGIIGAILGLVFSLVFGGIPGDGGAGGAGVIGGVVGGATLGAVAGALTLAFGRMRQMVAADELKDEHVQVALHTDDESELEPAAEVLQEAGPARIDLFDNGWKLMRSMPGHHGGGGRGGDGTQGGRRRGSRRSAFR